jgi:hypothetical protein
LARWKSPGVSCFWLLSAGFSHGGRDGGKEGEPDDKRTLFHGFGKTDYGGYCLRLLLTWAQGMLVHKLAMPALRTDMPDYPFLEIANTAFSFVHALAFSFLCT